MQLCVGLVAHFTFAHPKLTRIDSGFFEYSFAPLIELQIQFCDPFVAIQRIR